MFRSYDRIVSRYTAQQAHRQSTEHRVFLNCDFSKEQNMLPDDGL